MEIWKYGNIEIWKFGNLEIWKYENIELWKTMLKCAQQIMTLHKLTHL